MNFARRANGKFKISSMSVSAIRQTISFSTKNVYRKLIFNAFITKCHFEILRKKNRPIGIISLNDQA